MHYNKSNTTCNNCGKVGHMFHQCKMPITSYGLIVFRKNPLTNQLEYLMVRRKNSFGFIDFMRGKYTFSSAYQLKLIINEMSNKEKQDILTKSFHELWSDMWGNGNGNGGENELSSSVMAPSSPQSPQSPIRYSNEEYNSKKKFELLRSGVEIDGKMVTLNELIEESGTNWEETEWEFSKGRKNQKEKELECALREFKEETGLQLKIQIIENIIPFEETFIGSNHKAYKHKYFLGYESNLEMDKQNDTSHYQKTEISKIEWKTLEECLVHIRPYHLEKKEIITNVDKILKTYFLYS